MNSSGYGNQSSYGGFGQQGLGQQGYGQSMGGYGRGSPMGGNQTPSFGWNPNQQMGFKPRGMQPYQSGPMQAPPPPQRGAPSNTDWLQNMGQYAQSFQPQNNRMYYNNDTMQPPNQDQLNGWGNMSQLFGPVPGGSAYPNMDFYANNGRNAGAADVFNGTASAATGAGHGFINPAYAANNPLARGGVQAPGFSQWMLGR